MAKQEVESRKTKPNNKTSHGEVDKVVVERNESGHNKSKYM